jgi:hypothetical protein
VLKLCNQPKHALQLRMSHMLLMLRHRMVLQMLPHLRLRHHMLKAIMLLLQQALMLLHQLFCSEPFLSPR